MFLCLTFAWFLARKWRKNNSNNQPTFKGVRLITWKFNAVVHFRMSPFRSVETTKVDGQYASSHLNQGVRSMWLQTGSSVDRPKHMSLERDTTSHIAVKWERTIFSHVFLLYCVLILHKIVHAIEISTVWIFGLGKEQESFLSTKVHKLRYILTVVCY